MRIYEKLRNNVMILEIYEKTSRNFLKYYRENMGKLHGIKRDYSGKIKKQLKKNCYF